MLHSSTIIIFREVFEIVLILSIVLAATRNLAGRNRWIAGGFGLGITGSFLVALFMDKISSFADGLGQEIFNAAVLFTAAGFIGWTVLWMKQHAREMKSHFQKLSTSLEAGDTPLYTLTIVIALALLREGAEIVLFMYGMLAAGESPTTLLQGSLIGMAGGLILGGAIYYGLIQLSMRHFFMVTTWLLLFLVAGMVSQGIGQLVAAGYFEQLSKIVWDSNWLISDSSMAGRSLATLIGYTAEPTEIQLLAYILTLGGLAFAIRHSGTSPSPSHSKS